MVNCLYVFNSLLFVFSFVCVFIYLLLVTLSLSSLSFVLKYNLIWCVSFLYLLYFLSNIFAVVINIFIFTVLISLYWCKFLSNYFYWLVGKVVVFFYKKSLNLVRGDSFRSDIISFGLISGVSLKLWYLLLHDSICISRKYLIITFIHIFSFGVDILIFQ